MSSANTRGGRLREGRLNLKKTPEEIAGEVSASVSTYLKWEYDQTQPRTLDQVSAVCKAVGISTDYYINGEDCMPALPAQEQDVIEAYRKLPPELQASINLLVIAAAKPGE